MSEEEIERFSKESQEKSAERAGYFYHQIIKKDAEIERLKDLARRLVQGWDMERHCEFSCGLSFGDKEWEHWEMIKDPEVKALFEDGR